MIWTRSWNFTEGEIQIPLYCNGRAEPKNLEKNSLILAPVEVDYLKNSQLNVVFLTLVWFTAFQINSKIKFYPAQLPLKWQLYGAFQPRDSGKLIY